MRRNHKNHIGSPCRPVFAFSFLLRKLITACAVKINALLTNARKDHSILLKFTSGSRPSSSRPGQYLNPFTGSMVPICTTAPAMSSFHRPKDTTAIISCYGKLIILKCLKQVNWPELCIFIAYGHLFCSKSETARFLLHSKQTKNMHLYLGIFKEKIILNPQMYI